MKDAWDLILVGAGLANGVLAWRLRNARPELSVLVVEQAPVLGGSHTWSFHRSDLTPAQNQWLAPLVSHRWPGYRVRFPHLERQFEGEYCSISGTHFAEVLSSCLGRQLMLGASVRRLTPDRVQLATGETLRARAVIDGRGLAQTPNLRLGFQNFLGQEFQLSAPHGLDLPLVMDATVPQADGYRFVYVLPLGPERLLVEDTYYSEASQFDQACLRERISAYVRGKGWAVRDLLREEQGSLPIVLAGRFDAFHAEGQGVPRTGLRAGLFHPVTGYSLPEAVRLADLLATAPALNAEVLHLLLQGYRRQLWRRHRFFRLLNRMLFLAGRPQDRWRVLERFHRLAPGLIQRFYAGAPTVLDKARLLIGKPPVPVMPALHAMLDFAPPRQESP